MHRGVTFSLSEVRPWKRYLDAKPYQDINEILSASREFSLSPPWISSEKEVVISSRVLLRAIFCRHRICSLSE
jgi:hypothetical protein